MLSVYGSFAVPRLQRLYVLRFCSLQTCLQGLRQLSLSFFMKQFISVLLAISIIGIPVFSQANQKVIKIPTTWGIAKESKKLNGQLRGQLGGTSRSVIAIVLPSNTVEWHYSFTTRKDGAAEKNLQLGFQIAGILASVYTGGASSVLFSGISKAAAQSISTPSGSVPVNAYVLSANQSANFQNGAKFTYYASGSMTNVTQGTRQTPYIGSDLLYLGLENLSNINAVNVDVEIVAVVMEDKLIADQTEQSSNSNPVAITYSKSEFIGTWKDDNSTFTLSGDGNLYTRWDNGKTARGKWDLINNKLNFDHSGIESNKYKGNDFYKILFWDGETLKYQSIKDGKTGRTYNARKIPQ